MRPYLALLALASSGLLAVLSTPASASPETCESGGVDFDCEGCTFYLLTEWNGPRRVCAKGEHCDVDVAAVFRPTAWPDFLPGPLCVEAPEGLLDYGALHRDRELAKNLLLDGLRRVERSPSCHDRMAGEEP